MGVKKAFRDVIGIVVSVHEFVVTTVVGSPVQNRVFKSRRTKQQREQPHRPARLERSMGEKAVVTQGDTDPGAQKENRKQRCLKLAQPEAPQVKRDSGQGNEKRADEEHAVFTVNRLPR